MSTDAFPPSLVTPLLGVYAGVGAGWLLGRLGWLRGLWRRSGLVRAPAPAGDPVRLLAALAFLVFVPALLFRTTARLDPSGLPWMTMAAYFLPASLLLLGVHAWNVRRRPSAASGDAPPPQAPAVRAITATFGNTAQLGIPVSTALFGETGLALHLAVIALHALTLMTLATVLAEVAAARRAGVDPALNRGRARRLLGIAGVTARRSIVHPVVLPVLAGLAWNATGWPLPAPVDAALAVLAAIAVPMCLALIGLSLAEARGLAVLRESIGLVAFKLLAMPAVIAAVAHGVFGLDGLPLSVLVMCAALPAGANALLFAQRYRVLEAQTAAAVAGSTVLFALTAPLWVLALALLR